MIIALAGRRVDPIDSATPRFRLEEAGVVFDRIRSLLWEAGATDLISSGACGADLLAMQAASELGLRRRMVLPFEPNRFRLESVVDRPGDWGPPFDRIARELAASGDLIVLEQQSDSHAAHLATNAAILEEALQLIRAAGVEQDAGVVAVVVWDGQERGPSDVTADFARQARARGLRVLEVSTRAADPHGLNRTRPQSD